MEPIIQPTVKFNDLDQDTRKVVLKLVRMFVEKTPEVKQLMGIDCAEETVISLMDKGFIKMRMDDEENIHFGIYHIEQGRYLFPSLGDSWQL